MILSEIAINMMNGISSTNMADSMGSFDNGYIHQFEQLDDKNLLDDKLQCLQGADYQLSEIDEYISWRFEEDYDEGLKHALSCYRQYKSFKSMAGGSILDAKTALTNDYDGVDNSLLISALNLLSNASGVDVPLVQLEQLDLSHPEDDTTIYDLRSSLIAFYEFNYDEEFNETIQCNWENGAIFGNFVSLEKNSPQQLVAWLERIATGVTAATLIEQWFDQLPDHIKQ